MPSFGECLTFHLKRGTRPGGKQKEWSNLEFAEVVGRSSGRTVGNWRNDKNVPENVFDLERAIFGDNPIEAYASWHAEFTEAHRAYWRARSRPAQPQWTASPYPGLRRFEPHEAAIFFGREREVHHLAELLLDPGGGFIAVIGASGTGKSSLVSAGALPALTARGHGWPVVSFSPGFAGDNPVLALAIELAKQLSPPVKPGGLARRLAAEPASIAHYAQEVLKGRADETALVLFVDQFEELFKDAAEHHRQSFIALLDAAFDEPRLRTIVTLREDFLGVLANDPALAKILQQGRSYPLGVPSFSALVKMIRGPAELAGLAIDDALIDQLVTDAGPVPGEALPLVAFCLEALHRQAQPRQHLTEPDYAAIGGLRGAMARRMDETLSGLGLDQHQRTAGLDQLYPLIVSIDAAGRAARRWVPRHAIASLPEPAPKLAETLIENGLLLARQSEADEVVTLRHETLIQEWTGLHNWVLLNGHFLQRMQSLLLLLHTPSDRDHAAPALVEMSALLPDIIVGALIDLMGKSNSAGRVGAVEVLAEIGQLAAAAVPTLIEALRDDDGVLRSAAAQALGRIGPAAVDAVPALIEALRDGDKALRRCAAEALGQIGTDAAEAVPALVEGLRDDDAQVRSWAALTLRGIAPTATEAVPALIKALRDGDETVRRTARQALDKIQPDAP